MTAMKKTNIFAALLIALAVLPVALTTCNSPFGMGDAIDWEPPVLTLDPAPPNPFYVKQGAVLSGTVTDNIIVDRVILREASTGKQLFRATVKGDRWEIRMDFGPEQNNEKIAVEIVAYDRAGNSGDQSIRAVTLVVDIRPPIIDDVWIQKTDVKRAELEPYNSLFDLETHDPRGERSENVNRYQNGFFTMAGQVAESETRIDIVSLRIFDSRDPNNALLELPKTEGSTNFSPRWIVSEEALLDAGDARWPGYKNTYYTNQNARYYYRVQVTGYDRSRNESEYHENFYLSDLRVEEQGFFCMWQNADIPKGIVDPMVAGSSRDIVVTKGATLPVVFFDDDQLLYAFTGLLTIEQWNGTKSVGATITGADDAAKLQWLSARLKAGDDTYDWRYDRYNSNTYKITNQAFDYENGIQKDIDYTTYAVQTGGSAADNGQFVLFSVTADKKLSPHTGTGPYDTNQTRERLDLWYVNVIDENEPLIVFDTVNTKSPGYNPATHPGGDVLENTPAARTGDSPEENTFPRLTNGSTFVINGYTLRANKASVATANRSTVTKFRIAWIPAVRGESLIPDVQRALQSGDYPLTGTGGSMAALEALGVQHWNFTQAGGSNNGTLLTGKDQVLDTNNDEDIFTKQVFKKTFSVLPGQTDDLRGGAPFNYKNFTYKVGDTEIHENETKLFIVYAEDNMGHVVFRQLRLLENKTPPEMTIYDLTRYPASMSVGPANGLPNLNNENKAQTGWYFYNSDGIIDAVGRSNYEGKRFDYQPTGYTNLTSIGKGPSDIAGVNAAYPRDTIIKYWVSAKSNGDLAVNSITVRDISSASSLSQIGYFNPTANSNAEKTLSYVEMLSEVTQRVFLFTATDSLGNVANVQRTVAVTNAAVLNNITTTTQTGSYGIGETITLKANFSNSVRWTTTGNANNDANKPKLNVRFKRGATWNNLTGSDVVLEIPTSTPVNTDSLSLEFPYTILEGDAGIIETMFNNMTTTNGNGGVGTEGNNTNRPIKLPSGTRIIDSSRGDGAFTPRNPANEGDVPSYDWDENNGPGRSLQNGKAIRLQGIRPRLMEFSMITEKTGQPYTSNPFGFFFKADETVEFMIVSDKEIFAGSPAPAVEFQVGTNTTEWRNAAWSRTGTANQMIFSVAINGTYTPQDGQIMAIRLNNSASIVDNVGNAVSNGLVTPAVYAPGAIILRQESDGVNSNNIYIDKVAPTAPTVTLTPPGSLINGNTAPAIGSNPDNTIYYRYAPRLEISGNGGETSPGTWYSLNGGVSWEEYSVPVDLSNTNGAVEFQARFIDRAGNIGAVTRQSININAKFPSLISITARNPNGNYTSAAGNNSLSFDLSFDAPIWTQTLNNATITLTNRNASNTPKAGTTNDTDGLPSFQKRLTATAIARPTATTSTTTVTFVWNNITGKEMLDGLYISAVNFTGLSDRFGNPGGAGTATISGTTPSTLAVTIPGDGNSQPAVTNLNGGGIKVDCLAPIFQQDAANTAPKNGVNLAATAMAPAVMTEANNNSGTLVLVFDEPVQRGSGTITIKPHGQFLIPPVFENDGYYLKEDGNLRSANYVSGYTRVDGFYDIYNSSLLNDTDKRTLVAGTNMSNGLTLNARTGQNIGPYIRMTQGLKEGAGYTGSYASAGSNAPNPSGTDLMVPDTSTKWVLDYRYSINNTQNTYYIPAANGNPEPVQANSTTVLSEAHNGTNGAPSIYNNSVVGEIRRVLTKAKFRWQEIDVTASNVTFSNDNKTVTIKLNEPLLRGLKWDLCYQAGTFTDIAGNGVAALNYSGTPAVIAGQGVSDSEFMFWSYGVRAPVIRVNRKSYDAKIQNWSSTTRTYANPTNRAEATYPSAGWGIENFNVVHYRIETETPDARLDYGTITGADGTGSVYVADDTVVNAAWPGNVPNATPNVAWDTTTGSNGTWVRPNLVRRAAGTGGTGYTLLENGVTIQRNFMGDYRGFRSYNKDATKTEITSLSLGTSITSSVSSGTTLNFNYNATQASKNYVVAQARVNHNGTGWNQTTAGYISPKGYEGVFRSVVALLQTGGGTQTQGNRGNYILVEGSNLKNGMPSISGFPVRDAEETGDNRFVKMFYRGTTTNTQWYWVSTEIVSEWYFIKWGFDGSHSRDGEINNYLSAGYGDLTFGHNVRGW